MDEFRSWGFNCRPAAFALGLALAVPADAFQVVRDHVAEKLRLVLGGSLSDAVDDLVRTLKHPTFPAAGVPRQLERVGILFGRQAFHEMVHFSSSLKREYGRAHPRNRLRFVSSTLTDY